MRAAWPRASGRKEGATVGLAGVDSDPIRGVRALSRRTGDLGGVITVGGARVKTIVQGLQKRGALDEAIGRRLEAERERVADESTR